MAVTAFSELICPLDGGVLQLAGQSWRCEQGHCFDVASQGYIHLLPVQNKRSKDPGDSKEMVAARRRYLDSGVYQPIADWMAAAALQGVNAGQALACLDAGCGEGYYLRQLAQQATGRVELAVLGLDISKWAVMAAAKRDKAMRWVVGSNANLPVEAATLDRVLCMFGFPVYSEFARVLKSGGRLLQIDAGPDHLRELREVIYPVLKPEKEAPTTAPEGFFLAGQDSLRYRFSLESAGQIADLLVMTPHLYRATAEGRARAAALTRIDLTVDVRLAVWQRN